MEEKGRNAAILIGVSVLAVAGTVTGIYLYRRKYLSSDFKRTELTRSTTATNLGIKEQFKPPKEIIRNGRKFAVKVLQPIRNVLGYPIFVSSWYRHPITNKAVGGVENSRHLKAQAADLRTVINGLFRNDLIAKAVLNAKVPFTKMILEGGTLDRPLAIHLAYTPGDNRQIILRQDKTGYSSLTRSDILNLS